MSRFSALFGVFLFLSAACGPQRAELLAPPPAALPIPALTDAPRYQGVLRKGASPETILPPEVFMGNAGVVVLFLDKAGLAGFCGPTPIACVGYVDGTRVMAMPNPCLLEVSKTEKHAAVTCHELGHVNGWSGEHGPPPG